MAGVRPTSYTHAMESCGSCGGSHSGITTIQAPGDVETYRCPETSAIVSVDDNTVVGELLSDGASVDEPDESASDGEDGTEAAQPSTVDVDGTEDTTESAPPLVSEFEGPNAEEGIPV